MTLDLDAIAVDLHGIMLANGLPSGLADHPIFKSFLREYKQAFAALLLEKVAQNCGGDCLLCMAEAGDPDCTQSVRKLLSSGSNFLPGAQYIFEMVARLAAEGDSLDQILSHIRNEVDLIRRYENGPGSCSDADAGVVR